MNEEFNPYNNPEQKNPQPTQQEAPQFVQQEAPRYAQPPQQQRFEPPYMPNKTEPSRYYPQQNYSNQNRPVRDPKGAARVFGMISFIIGCFVLPVTSMIFFNFRSSVNDKFGASVFFGMFLSLPAIIFGAVSLMKKTDKKLFPALGITFAGILLLCGFITYFFMVNGTANRYY